MIPLSPPVPREIKRLEARVGLTPGATKVPIFNLVLVWFAVCDAIACLGSLTCVPLVPVNQDFIKHSHAVVVERGAGAGSGFTDDDYTQAGCELVDGPEEVYKRGDMIVKVKEPLASEFELIRAGQTIFTYFHFASSPELTNAMVKSKANCIAYETVARLDESLPLLVPMSEIAGRMATQCGAKYLEKPMGACRQRLCCVNCCPQRLSCRPCDPSSRSPIRLQAAGASSLGVCLGWPRATF